MRISENIGHLITIKNIVKNENYYMFLYITGNEGTDEYKNVINGIRTIRLPNKMKKHISIQADQVTDFSRIEQIFPNTIGTRIDKLPVIAFYDKRNETFKESLFYLGVINIIENRRKFFPSNCLSSVATGSDFFDREEILNKILNRIQKDQNVLLSGPRRYGKTSIMRAIENMVDYYEYKSVMIDLESIYSPEQFIARIWSEVTFFGKSEKEKNSQAEKKEEELKENWEEKGSEVFKNMLKKKEKFLFLLDECPYMLDSFLGIFNLMTVEIDTMSLERTNKFIQWFRKQRELSKNKFVFLLAGSVHLKTYLRDNDLYKEGFSDCTEIRLTYFNIETVRNYIESLLLREEIILKDELIDELVKLLTPGIPYFIQVVINHIVSLYRKNPTFSIQDIKKNYEEKIIGLDSRRLFDTFERHFKRYGRRMSGAKEILKELANAGDKGIEKQKLREIYKLHSTDISKFEIVLNYLEYDFYIEKIIYTDKFRFASPILRDYWKKNQN